MPPFLKEFLTQRLSPEQKDELWRWADGNNASSQIVDLIARSCGCWHALFPGHGPDCTLVAQKESKSHGHCA